MRYLLTGGSGYIGSRLVERLAGEGHEVLICDVRPPRVFRPSASYRELDVRDSRAVRSAVESWRPDAVVHLAFLLNPIHDEAFMYSVDVEGTHNVLDACSSGGVVQVLVTSSSTAYGAFPDNPVPIDEEQPVRGAPDHAYARDKAEADRLCQLWALRHPERKMTIVRPCIVFGPSVNNYIVRFWTKQPFQADLGNLDGPIQFVHEDDVVDALTGLLEGAHEGAYNLAADGYMTLREAAEIAGLPVRRVPLRPYRAFAAAMWRLRMSEAPPGQIEFARWPWVVSNEKLKRTLGWTARHTTRETFEITMRAQGKIGGAPPATAEPAAKPPEAAPVA